MERAAALPNAVDLELRCIALGLTLKVDDPACGAPKERDAPEQRRLPCLVTGAWAAYQSALTLSLADPPALSALLKDTPSITFPLDSLPSIHPGMPHSGLEELVTLAKRLGLPLSTGYADEVIASEDRGAIASDCLAIALGEAAHGPLSLTPG